MKAVPPTITVSDEDRQRIESVETLARAGADGAPLLLNLLDHPSWAVRRAVVAALARVGDIAVSGLCDVLVSRRDNESRLAATVDALAASCADVTPALVALTVDAPAPVLCDILQVLGRRKAHEALPTAIQLASHPDDNVGVAAVEAMGRIGGRDTVEPLVASVQSKNFFRMFASIDALGRTGDPRAIAPLEGLLDDPFYAAEATRALGRTGLEAAVTGLARVLNRSSALLVRTAAIALVDLRDRYEAKFGDAAPIVLELRRHVLPPSVAWKMCECLAGAVASERVALAHVIGWSGDEAGILRLIELLDGEPAVARAAEEALRRLGAEASPFVLDALQRADSAGRLRLLPLVGHVGSRVEGLVSCLEDPDPTVRTLACDALARAGNTSVVPALFRVLGHADPRVSQAAGAAIQSLGSIETKRLALLEARSADPRTRRAALRIIAYFGYPEGLDLLIAAMGDPDERIRETAIQGLPMLDDEQATLALLAASSNEASKSRAAAMRALGNTKAREDVIAALGRGLRDPDPWVRYYACQSLAKLDVVAATSAIIDRMNDDAGQVRVAAVEALARLRSDAALDALAAAAGSLDGDIRRAALVGLGVARSAQHFGILRDAATAQDGATRLVAISAIAEFDSNEVVPILSHAASDPEEGVRGAAIGFLSTRPGPAATHALIEHLSHPLTRDRVLLALAVTPDERVDGISIALDHAGAELAELLVTALTRMRRASGVSVIATVLESSNVHARRAAVSALASINTAEAIAALEGAMASDPDPEIRRIGSAALLPS